MDCNNSDRELLAGITHRDSTCFDLFVRRYSAYAAKIITMVGGSFLRIQDIEELTADVFVSIWRNAEKIDIKGDSLKCYIAAVARNKAKTALKQDNINFLPLDEDVISTERDLDDRIIAAETDNLVIEVVKSMFEPDRGIFIRRYFYFQKTSEIAKQLSINKKTVETRLLRGREKLRKTFLERGISL